MCYINWNPPLELFSLGELPIRWYGLLWAVGLIVASFIVSRLYRANNADVNSAEILFVYCLIGVLLGARLGHCLFYDSEYYFSCWQHFVEMLIPVHFSPDGSVSYIGYAGLASHGGTIGLIVALWLYCKTCNMKLVFVLDCVAIAAPFTSMAIRLGNLMNSEIIGRPTEVSWAFVFEKIDLVPRHPAQLYEAIFYLFVFIVGLLIYRKTKLHNELGSGFFVGYCLTSIFTFRFFIEFLKEVQVDFEKSMSLDMGQILSVPLIVVGLFFVCRSLVIISRKSLSNDIQ